MRANEEKFLQQAVSSLAVLDARGSTWQHEPDVKTLHHTSREGLAAIMESLCRQRAIRALCLSAQYHLLKQGQGALAQLPNESRRLHKLVKY
jgi:hypothetical protein